MRHSLGPFVRPLAVLAFAFAPAVASAQATMTFAPVACSGNQGISVGPTYTEAGFNITAPDLATWCTGAAHYAGSNLFMNFANTTGVLTKVGGSTFSINSIDLAHVYAGSYGAQSYTFTGNVFGGGQVFDTFTIAAQSGTPVFQTFNFSAGFTNLTSVDLASQDPNYYQYSNIKLDAVTATPEPASMMLVATGLLGVFGVARRKQKA